MRVSTPESLEGALIVGTTAGSLVMFIFPGLLYAAATRRGGLHAPFPLLSNANTSLPSDWRPAPFHYKRRQAQGILMVVFGSITGIFGLISIVVNWKSV